MANTWSMGGLGDMSLEQRPGSRRDLQYELQLLQDYLHLSMISELNRSNPLKPTGK